MTTVVEVINWPNGICEDKLTTIPDRGLYRIGEYIIDINSVIGVGPFVATGTGTGLVGMPGFVIFLPAGNILIEDDDAKALHLNLINVLETIFGAIGKIDDCPF
jgi:hypothetical protein